MSVSYAPPAYYADRLCERGRCYLRQWFSPEKSSKHYLDFEKEKKNIKQSNQKVLEKIRSEFSSQQTKEGKNARKTDEQMDKERKHREDADKKLVGAFKDKAQAYLGDDGPGSWHRNLDDTMFWM